MTGCPHCSATGTVLGVPCMRCRGLGRVPTACTCTEGFLPCVVDHSDRAAFSTAYRELAEALAESVRFRARHCGTWPAFSQEAR